MSTKHLIPAALAALALATSAGPALAGDVSVIRAVDRGSTAIANAHRDVSDCFDLALYEYECDGAQLDRADAHRAAIARLDAAKHDRARERPAVLALYRATRTYWTTSLAIDVALYRGNAFKARRLLPVLERQSKVMLRAYKRALTIVARERGRR